MTDLHDERHVRRETFGSVAQQYERWRPTYPDALFDELAKVTNLPADGVALEIGCGTGQATEPLSRMVARLHVVDLSAELIEFTRAKLSDRRNIAWHRTPFEQLDLLPGSCDLIGAWTSFHWLDPAVRHQRAAELLTADGWLAIVKSDELVGGTPDFFETRQRLYAELPHQGPVRQLATEPDVADIVEDFRASQVFEEPLVRSFDTLETHTGESYAGLLSTFSDVLALREDDRRRLLDGHRQLIDQEFGGAITRRMVHSMVLAKKRTTAAPST